MKESKIKSILFWILALILVICLSLLSGYLWKSSQEGQVDIMGEVSDISGPIPGFPQIDSNGVIYSIALSEDERILYVGGEFSSVGGIERHNLAAIDTSTYQVTDWSPSAEGGPVYVIEFSGNSVYVGGSFNDITDVSGDTIITGEFAKISANGMVDTNCFPSIDSTWKYPSSVYSIEVTPEYIYVGGSFDRVGRIKVTGLVRLNRYSCEFDDTWVPSIQGLEERVLTILAEEEWIYVGGSFSEVNGTAVNSFARLGLDGTLDSSCNPNISSRFGYLGVSSIKQDKDSIYIGGRFGGVEENPVTNLARLSKSTCAWDSSWIPDLTPVDPHSGRIIDLEPHSSGVFVGGVLFHFGTKRTEFGRVSTGNGLVDPNWELEVEAPDWETFTVYSLAVGSKFVYIGGSFETIGEENVKGLAAFNIDALPPVGGVSINRNAVYTNSANVQLDLSATDEMNNVTEMMICNNRSFIGCNWEPYTTTKAWTLDSTLGTKIVYVKFKDSIGHVSDVTSDSILLRVSNIVITDIGLIKNIPDRDSLRYYFTSTEPLIKGLTQSDSTVYFVYGDETYRANADSNGKFSISFTVARGVNTIQYYSKDISGNQSNTKTLILTVGIENFPDSVLEKLGLTTKPEQKDDVIEEKLSIGEGIVEEIPTMDLEQEQEDDTQVIQESGKKFQLVRVLDKNGKPMVKASVEIDGYFYITDQRGEFQTEALKYDRSYKIKVEYKGVKFEADVLGTSESQEIIEVVLSRDSILDKIDPKYLYLLLLLILLSLLTVLWVLLRRRKKKEKE